MVPVFENVSLLAMSNLEQRQRTLSILCDAFHTCNVDCRQPCTARKNLITIVISVAKICDRINNSSVQTRSIPYNQVDNIFETVAVQAWRLWHDAQQLTSQDLDFSVGGLAQDAFEAYLME